MRKNRNRSSELDGKNDNEAPKSRVAERRFAIHDVVCKEKAARACCCRRAKNMIDKLQEKTLYDGQSEYYRNLQ